MIPSDASFWAAQVQQAYEEAASQSPVIAPASWELVSRLYVTERVCLWSETSLIGFILRHSLNGLAVAIRGTDSVFDWLEDLEAVIGSSGVEEGFQNVFSGTALDSGQSLASWLSGQTGPVLLTGHSLGASVATIAASCCPSAVNPRLLTFASPRTGSIAFAGSLLPRLAPGSSRIVNIRDIVPDLPEIVSPVPELDFAHVGLADTIDSNTIPEIGASLAARHALSTYQRLISP